MLVAVEEEDKEDFPSHLPALRAFSTSDATNNTRSTMFECKKASAMKMNRSNVPIFDLTGESRQGVT